MTTGPTQTPDFFGDAADFVDAAPCGIVVADAQTHVVGYVNSTLRIIVGASESEVVGAPLARLFATDSQESLTALLRALANGGDEPVGVIASLAGPGGTAAASVSLMASRYEAASGSTWLRISVHPTPTRTLSEGELVTARRVAESAQYTAEAALGRSQSALEASEDARKAAEAERTHVQMLASTLQRSLLPPALSAPPGMDVSGFYHPASIDEVGGDFYDVFPLDDRTWAFFLGDVSGKGAGAAVVTSLTRYTLRAAAVFDRDPIAVLQNLNSILHQQFTGDDPRFCTVVFGVLSRRDDGVTIDLASGGHPPALVLRSDGTAEHIHTRGGQLVGALASAHFVSASVTLSPGEVMVLYTDGLTEAIVGPGRERYDDDGALEEFAADASPTTADAIIDRLADLLSGFGVGLQDDVALLALGVPPAE